MLQLAAEAADEPGKDLEPRPEKKKLFSKPLGLVDVSGKVDRDSKGTSSAKSGENDDLLSISSVPRTEMEELSLTQTSASRNSASDAESTACGGLDADGGTSSVACGIAAESGVGSDCPCVTNKVVADS